MKHEKKQENIANSQKMLTETVPREVIELKRLKSIIFIILKSWLKFTFITVLQATPVPVPSPPWASVRL